MGGTRVRRAALIGCGACVLVLAGCSPGPEEGRAAGEGGGDPVAWVDGAPIGADEIVGRARLRTPDSRRQAVEGAVDDHLAVREARRRGLDRAPRVERALRAARREAERKQRRALRDALIDSIEADIRVSDAELREHFEATRPLYRERRMTLRRRGFATEAAARSAASGLGADSLLSLEGAEEVGPATMRDLPRDWRGEAKALRRVGDWIVIPRQESWWILQLTDDRAVEPTSFEQVRGQVRQSLRRERARRDLAALLRELRDDADVRVVDEALADEAIWRSGR